MQSLLSRMNSKKESVLSSSSFSFEHPFLQQRKRPQFRPSHPYNAFFLADQARTLYSTNGIKSQQQRLRRLLLLGLVGSALTAMAWRRTRRHVSPGNGRAAAAPLGRSNHPTPSTATVKSILPNKIGAKHPSHDTKSGKRTDTAASIEIKPSCDCFTPVDQLPVSSDTQPCCQRLALRAHKMGVVLLRDYLPEIPSAIIHPKELPARSEQDYRHVVLTRPLHDAIISGYLYHKTGRECWLDQNGRPRHVNKTFEWQQHLQYPLVWPPDGINAAPSTTINTTLASNTTALTLCEFLSTTADTYHKEYQAMKTYMDWSLHDLYAGLVPYFKEVKRRKAENKTLFVCFDSLSNPQTQAKTLQTMRQWLYPSKSNPQNARTGRREAAVVSASTTTTPKKAGAVSYQGGHATSKDPELRQRLMTLIDELDREFFQGQTAQATQLFGCNTRTR